ncbi:septation protein SepH [Streptosporangium sp. NPDC000396]|uniref:septation protein SepH n=1 Tax=Streptosporangium sp. NPDC000396 TaxID=3366185 RepID=UPI0036D16878
MQELRLVAVSEDGTYLVLATAGRGTRFTLPVDDRLRAAVRGNFSRLGQYEIEVESPLRPKEIQARIRAGETAEEIAATAGIPVERVRWFEGPVLQEREYMAQQAQRCAVRLPGDSAPGPTLGDLVAERLTRRGVPADEIDWDSAKRDDNLWRIKLGFVWNGHSRHAEWIFDPRRRHITPHDDEAMRLSSGDYVEPVEDSTVTPFVPRVAKLAPVPPLAPEPLNQPPVSFPSVVRQQEPQTPPLPEAPAAHAQPEAPAVYEHPPMPPIPEGFEAPRPTVPPLRAPSPVPYEPVRVAEPVRTPESASAASEPVPLGTAPEPLTQARAPETARAPEPVAPAATAEPAPEQVVVKVPGVVEIPEAPQTAPAVAEVTPEPVKVKPEPALERSPAPEAAGTVPEAKATPVTEPEPVPETPIAVPAARRPQAGQPREDAPADTGAAKEAVADKVADKPVEPPKPAPTRPAKKARGRRASVPTWDEIMFGARRQD